MILHIRKKGRIVAVVDIVIVVVFFFFFFVFRDRRDRNSFKHHGKNLFAEHHHRHPTITYTFSTRLIYTAQFNSNLYVYYIVHILSYIHLFAHNICVCNSNYIFANIKQPIYLCRETHTLTTQSFQ